MKFKFFTIIGLLLLAININGEPSFQSYNDDFCGISNRSFRVNEKVNYKVFYSIAGIYIDAGDATFTSTLQKLNNRPVFHVVADGKTNPRYDWIFKVRDRYESFIDTSSMQPLKFIRNVSEGSYKKYENVTFNRDANTAVTNDGVYKVPNCVQDVISSIYYARNIDFSRYKPGDRINFSMFLDN